MSDTIVAPREVQIRAPTSAPQTAAAPASPPQDGERPKRDPMLDLLDKFEKVAAAIGTRDPGMAAGLKQLVAQSSEPGRTEQPLFRTQVAYVLQDVEKMTGTKAVTVPAELRAKLTQLAATSPGLDNQRMQALVGATPGVADRGVIRDVRRAAATIAGMGDQQNTPQVQEMVAVLENRMRLATRFSPYQDVASASTTAAPASPSSETAQSRSVTESQAAQTDREAKAQGPESRQTVPNQTALAVEQGGPQEKTRAAASPGDGSRPGEPQPQAAQTQPTAANDQVRPVSTSVRTKGLISSIMDNARAPSGGLDPWEPPPVAMKRRVLSFEENLASGRTDQHIRAAEKSGEKLMQAMETFMTGPGAGVLGKIEAAASTEPGGMRAVMSEMQPGGRYATLRSEFDNALQQDRAFAASFNAVERAAGQYGHDRLTLGADFQSRKLDASQLDARFQRADAAIGEAAERIPGRAPGQSIMAEMAEKVGELLSKAVERVRQMFGKDVEAGPKQSNSAGMNP